MGRVGAEEMAELAQLDLARHRRHVAGDVAEKQLPFFRGQQAEEVAGLRVVVVADAVVVARRRTVDRERRFDQRTGRLRRGPPKLLGS